MNVGVRRENTRQVVVRTRLDREALLVWKFLMLDDNILSEYCTWDNLGREASIRQLGSTETVTALSTTNILGRKGRLITSPPSLSRSYR